MIPSKLEVLVDFGPTPDKVTVEKTLNYLNAQDDVQQAVFKNGAVMVETVLPSSVVLDMVIKTSGKRAVLQGYGDSTSAVAMVSSKCTTEQVLGVIRFTQTDSVLIADGSVDGLTPGLHGLHVHESGDLSMTTYGRRFSYFALIAGRRDEYACHLVSLLIIYGQRFLSK
nr:copper chaperone for superoxide dismutase-like [Danaus plexippus plexippus]